MKFSTSILLTVAACSLTTSSAFTPATRRIIQRPGTTLNNKQSYLAMSSTAATESDFGTAMPEAATPLEMLGMKEGSLALGVDPIQVLTYIGTRENLIAKTLEDISGFDRPKAEAEVDKFFMDSEMVNLYIQYQKMIEEDPSFVVPEAKKEDEGLFSLRNVLIGYGVYTAINQGPTMIKSYVAGEQAAGNWHGTNIPFIDTWLEKSMAGGADAVTDAVQAVSDAAGAQ